MVLSSSSLEVLDFWRIGDFHDIERLEQSEQASPSCTELLQDPRTPTDEVQPSVLQRDESSRQVTQDPIEESELLAVAWGLCAGGVIIAGLGTFLGLRGGGSTEENDSSNEPDDEESEGPSSEEQQQTSDTEEQDQTPPSAVQETQTRSRSSSISSIDSLYADPPPREPGSDTHGVSEQESRLRELRVGLQNWAGFESSSPTGAQVEAASRPTTPPRDPRPVLLQPLWTPPPHDRTAAPLGSMLVHNLHKTGQIYGEGPQKERSERRNSVSEPSTGYMTGPPQYSGPSTPADGQQSTPRGSDTSPSEGNPSPSDGNTSPSGGGPSPHNEDAPPEDDGSSNAGEGPSNPAGGPYHDAGGSSNTAGGPSNAGGGSSNTGEGPSHNSNKPPKQIWPWDYGARFFPPGSR